ncbi:BRcat and Rcat domain-containing protein [Aspergillus melleus]|uniref:BRcat and Rcat domain-containing protein n=1 Tax=Aspergillus melleus TaxID=138277 RepID=UPI001E8CB27A|nr:uncharacterized protein LDX57_012105 [Aspergillus melleus]KAH8434458.1 hypothetical protein LDX57_012105 [Aspergillus melleus]
MATPPIQPGQSSQSALDEEDLALAVQLAEIEIYHDNDKGKYRSDAPPDYENAILVFSDELTAYKVFLGDRKLANSIARAVEVDGPAISVIIEQEKQDQEDGRLARETAASDAPLESLEIDSQAGYLRSKTDQGKCNLTPRLKNTDDSDESNEAAGSSITYARRQAEAIQKMKTEVQCCVCLNDFLPHRTIRLECSDLYCDDCLRDLFLRATKDESLYPPRCCRVLIPLLLIQGHMSAEELTQFEAAAVEYNTTDRTYCSNMECCQFIPPSRITADRADCASCGFSTCTMCKNSFHQEDCAADSALQATLALADSKGWQRCFSCRSLVELGIGCYHITCKCKAQFCYLCGAKWKSCACQRWDEQRLEERAQEVVDREANQVLRPHDRQLRVARMQQELREVHECEHPGRFERIFGSGRRRFECEMCGSCHRKYILQCRRCHLRVCEDCRRNRI